MPVVSVVMPVHNHEATCAAALASIRQQSLRDVEIIAVDDGSTDGSRGALEHAAERDPRVRIVSIPHGGIVAALQAGVASSGAPLIARMDADDWSHPERIAKQVAFLDGNPDVGAVDCRVELGWSHVTGGGMVDYVGRLNSLLGWPDLRNSLFEESPLVHPAALMRRTALDAAGGYRDDPWPEDYSLWLRMVAAGYRLAKIDEVLFRWNDPPGRLTRTGPRYEGACIAALKARFLAVLRPQVAAQGCQLWGMGPTGKMTLSALQREGVRVVRAFDVDPRKIGNRVGGVRIHPLDELPSCRGQLTLVALGTRPAKALAQKHLAALKFAPWEDYLLLS